MINPTPEELANSVAQMDLEAINKMHNLALSLYRQSHKSEVIDWLIRNFHTGDLARIQAELDRTVVLAKELSGIIDRLDRARVMK